MFSKSALLKLVAFLLIVSLVVGIPLGTTVFADGGGAQPFPPDQSPSSGGDVGGSLLAVTLLTILQFIL